MSSFMYEAVCKFLISPHMLFRSTREGFNSMGCVMHIVPVSSPGWKKWHMTHPKCWPLKQKISLPAQWKVNTEGRRNGGSHFSNCELLLKVSQAASSLDKSQTREVRLVISRADRSPPLSPNWDIGCHRVTVFHEVPVTLIFFSVCWICLVYPLPELTAENR